MDWGFIQNQVTGLIQEVGYQVARIVDDYRAKMLDPAERRERIATAALQGLLANPFLMKLIQDEPGIDNLRGVTHEATRWADYLIATLDTKDGSP